MVNTVLLASRLFQNSLAGTCADVLTCTKRVSPLFHVNMLHFFMSTSYENVHFCLHFSTIQPLFYAVFFMHVSTIQPLLCCSMLGLVSTVGAQAFSEFTCRNLRWCPDLDQKGLAPVPCFHAPLLHFRISLLRSIKPNVYVWRTGAQVAVDTRLLMS